MKQILAIGLLSIILLVFVINLVQAAEVCAPCDTEGAVEDGLTCENGKWRGCPADAIICNPLTACDFTELIEVIINFVFSVALAIVPIMIIVGGFYFVTSGGDPNRIQTAKKIILYTLVGFGIILLAKGLIIVLKQIFGIEEEAYFRSLVLTSLLLKEKFYNFKF